MNGKLTKLSRLPVPDWQKARLQRWLHEWQVKEALLDQEDSKSDELDGGGLDGQVTWDRETEPVEVKDIRILWPVLAPRAGRPIYVAVLRALSNSSWLAAPYGRFSEPANEGELLTQREDAPLRVLCIWHALAMSTESLAQSWKVDVLSAMEFEQAITLRDSLEQNRPLPSGLREHVGPPVTHHADPRIIYIREETRLLRELDTTVVYPLSQYEELPKAADPGSPPYGTEPGNSPDGNSQ